MKSEASLARTKSHGGNVYYYQEPSTETIKVFCLLLYFRRFLYIAALVGDSKHPSNRHTLCNRGAPVSHSPFFSLSRSARPFRCLTSPQSPGKQAPWCYSVWVCRIPSRIIRQAKCSSFGRFYNTHRNHLNYDNNDTAATTRDPRWRPAGNQGRAFVPFLR